jgi:hypothetical protein
MNPRTTGDPQTHSSYYQTGGGSQGEEYEVELLKEKMRKKLRVSL